MFMAQIVVMISQAYIQTHPVVCIKRVQLFVRQSYSMMVTRGKGGGGG